MPWRSALPLAAVTSSGGKTYCCIYENGKAVRTEIKVGISDGNWIEVDRRVAAPPAKAPSDAHWRPIDGSEQVILGDVSALPDGAPVQVAPAMNGPD